MTTALQLLLFRHGAARAAGPDPALSPRGRDEVMAAIESIAVADLGETPLILHSTLSRAVQTAELFASRWPGAHRFASTALLPEADATQAARTVLAADRARASSLVVVAHLPLLPALARWLCEAECPFATGSGWLLTADADLAWQGSFEVVRAIEATQDSDSGRRMH